MPLVCRQCSRVNPDAAYYCYFDGSALAGRASIGGPVNLGTQPFPSPFVFASGVQCKNFDQLAVACQEHWKEAADALADGVIAGFFASIGRADLARAAKDAAEFPDRFRGLDQLLGKLPAHSLEPPKLRVEPTELNLGQLTVGVDVGFELHLDNQGGRLIFGAVSSDVPWLLFGSRSTKSFEFTDGATIPVRIRGKALRARLKPQVGNLTIESNVGSFTVKITIEVPPIPFREGVLAGAMSPRQIAERSRAEPTAVAPLFESGAVAKWFKENGLTYPVEGPTAPGTAGVQQFFEALGLAKPPKVECTPRPVEIVGRPGETFEVPLTVSTADKKLVYAYATSNQSWIDGVSVIRPAGRTCTIRLKILLPNKAGEHAAKVIIHANGGQRFSFPVKATVRSTMTRNALEVNSAARDDDFFAPAPITMHAVDLGDNPDIAFTPLAPMAHFQGPQARRWLHASPAILLVAVILGIMARDYFLANAESDVDPRDRIAVKWDWSPRNEKGVTNSLMYGFQDLTDPDQSKQLTFSSLGHTNSVVLLIDGKSRVFGKSGHGKLDLAPTLFKDRSRVCTWLFTDEHIAVTQTLQPIPGEPIEIADGVFKRFTDTVLVRYKITNNDKRPHDVGFRILLDAFIGANDVPLFAIPSRGGIVQTNTDLVGNDIPDTIQALEFPDLRNPGVIAQLNLKLGGKLEAPSRVMLTEYPARNRYQQFDLDADNNPALRPGQKITDSSIAMYWKTEPLAPGASREMGFTYGVATVGGMVELTILNPGPVVQGTNFSLVALIADAAPGSEATIALPAGLELAGSPAALPVPPAAKEGGTSHPSPVTWTIHAPNSGRYKIGVTANGVTTHRVVTVRKTSIF
jgi:hypothetical protein